MHRRSFVVEVILEMEFGQSEIPKDCHFLSGERPRHLALRLSKLASSGNDKERSVWGNEAGHSAYGVFSEGRGKNLESVGLKYKIESSRPFVWRS